MKKVFPRANKKLLKEGAQCLIFSALVLGVVSLIGLNFSFFNPFTNAFKDFSYLDIYYAEKLGDKSERIVDDIVLVNIDRLERGDIAMLLNKLKQQGPAVIGLDIIFKDVKGMSGDMALARSLESEEIVTTYAITDEGIDKSIEAIVKPGASMGYSNFSFDPTSSVVRNFQGIRKQGDSLQQAFGTAVVKKFMKARWDQDLNDYLQRERPINYRAKRENFLIFEADAIKNQDSLPVLKNKIVLLGYLGDAQNYKYDLEDKHFTPMNGKFVGKNPPDSFGLIIHANIILMLLNDDFISVVPNWVIAILTILFTYTALCYFIWVSKRQLASYILRLNVLRLAFIIFFVWLSLLLFKNKILLKTATMIAIVVFSIGLIGYYKKIAHFLYKKYKWKVYFYQE